MWALTAVQPLHIPERKAVKTSGIYEDLCSYRDCFLDNFQIENVIIILSLNLTNV